MPKSKCPTKWKVAHATKAEAQAHAAQLRRKPGGKAQHAYHCPEGHWHVGSGAVRRHAVNLKRKRR
jgi:GH24 family phage-related lysozyme (muramidase)